MPNVLTQQLTAQARLSPVDLALVALYLVAITLFGLRFRNKSKDKSLKNYFLANNTIPWWAIALSIVSAETSTLTIISIPGVAYAGDFGFLQIVLGYMLGRIVVAAVFLPRYFRGEMLTAYQLIAQRFGPNLHKLTAGLFLLTRATAEGVRVFAISIVVGIAIGTGDTLSIAIISALTLLYTFEGGMAAVIWTDVVQMALYVAGTLVALATLGAHAGGWSHIYAVAAPLGKFHWLDFSLSLTRSYTFWAGVLGGTFLTMASHGTDQLMVQRLLAARNLRESRLALLSSGAVIFLQFTLFLLIGAGLFVFYSQHPQAFASPDRIFPSFIVQQMPHGIAGLLVAAILAAAMSNLSAALNSLASTTVIDFIVPFQSKQIRVPQVSHLRPGSVPPRSSTETNTPGPPSIAPLAMGGIPSAPQPPNPGAPSIKPHPQAEPGAPSFEPHPKGGFSSEARPNSPPEDTTQISRLATLLWAVVLFAIAVYSIHVNGKGHVVEIALSIASVSYGCLLGVFLLGTLTKSATETGTIVGMAAGFLTNVLLYQATFPHPFIPLPLHVAFTWYVLIGSAMTFAIGTLASQATPRKLTAVLLLCLALSTPAQQPGAPSFPEPHPGKGGVSSEARPLSSSSPDFTPITTLLTQAIAKKQLPGAVVLIGHHGHIVFHHAYGQRKLLDEPGPNGNSPEPMTEGTLFDMASLTKVMVTTVAILQLTEQGKLDLDAPVSRYLPLFTTTTGDPNLVTGTVPRPAADALPAITIVGPDSRPQTTLWKSRITIRQLLTHYSGLPEDVSLKDPWGLQSPDKAEGIRRALAAVPYGAPGLTFKYSDVNFITLGALVEKVSGEPLNVYAANRIFAPLKMSSTAYHPFAGACPDATLAGSAIQYPTPAVNPAGLAKLNSTYTCGPYQWDVHTILDTAPTAYDLEGTAQSNPNFYELLRGTVHDPTTRRMGGVAGHAGVFSTAADAALFCQALLDKLVHNQGPFPLKQSTLQAALTPQAPATAVATATIFTQDGQPTKGVAQRALGWDLNSAFSRPRGEIFPITTLVRPGSFGHTGFTGTSLWLDPTSETYVILLSNAIHPHGNPPISTLRGQIATAAAQALALTPTLSSTTPPTTTPTTHTTTPGAPGLASETWVSKMPPNSPDQQSGAPSFESYPKGGVSSYARPPSSQEPDNPEPCLDQPTTACPGKIASSENGKITPNPIQTTTPGAPGLASETWVSKTPPNPPDPALPNQQQKAQGAPSIAPSAMGGIPVSPPTITPTTPGAPGLASETWVSKTPPNSPGPALPNQQQKAQGAPSIAPSAMGGIPVSPPTTTPTTPGAPGLASETRVSKTPPNSPGTALPNQQQAAQGAPSIAPSAMGGITVSTPTTTPGAPGLASETWVSKTPLNPPGPALPNQQQAVLKARLKSGYPHLVHTSYNHLIPAPPTLTGIDVLEQTNYAPLLTIAAHHQNHLRIAVLTNQSGQDAQGRRTIDLLLHANPAIELKTIFTPEHGLYGKQDTEHLQKEQDPTTHLPVVSLYGAKPSDRHPRQSDLQTIDAVVIDLQDAGVRFWTYTSVLGYFLQAAAQAHIEIVVLDRPNPLGGLAVQGPLSDPGTESYVNFMPIPIRHGMTFGELARFYNANARQTGTEAGAPGLDSETRAQTKPGLHAQLTVIPMQNWHRADFYQDTGLPWIPPSPNLRTPRAAILYPAIGLIETTNLSVGRGTPTPFENIGAPYLDPKALSSYLQARHLSGIEVTPTTLTIAETPERYPSHGQTIPGIHFEVTDPTHFNSPGFGLELLAALHHLYPTQFQLEKVKTLLLNAATFQALQANADLASLPPTWQPTLQPFLAQRAQSLLY